MTPKPPAIETHTQPTTYRSVTAVSRSRVSTAPSLSWPRPASDASTRTAPATAAHNPPTCATASVATSSCVACASSWARSGA